MTVSYLLKRFVVAAELEPLARHRHWTSSIPPETLRHLGVKDVAAPDHHTSGNFLDLVQRMDLENSLAEGLLTKADRAGMSSALELRAPFLDEAVMEFAATLPERERVRGLSTKVFLKRFARRYLPADIVYQRKRGLSVPMARWLRRPLHDWAATRLKDERLRMVGVCPERGRVIARRALQYENGSRQSPLDAHRLVGVAGTVVPGREELGATSAGAKRAGSTAST